MTLLQYRDRGKVLKPTSLSAHLALRTSHRVRSRDDINGIARGALSAWCSDVPLNMRAQTRQSGKVSKTVNSRVALLRMRRTCS
jgi:hypothetical protein